MTEREAQNKIFKSLGRIEGKLESLPCQDHANDIKQIRKTVNNNAIANATEQGRTKVDLISKGLVFMNSIAMIALTIFILFYRK